MRERPRDVMAVPSRVYVGMVVFGLIASLAVGAYTILVFSGYQPAPDSPAQRLFPADEPVNTGTNVFLVVAFLFSSVVTVMSWRALLAGARRDAGQRRSGSAAPPSQAPAPRIQRDPPGPPPGYQ